MYYGNEKNESQRSERKSKKGNIKVELKDE